MRLTVVGCSGSGPGLGSPASCYLVQAPYRGRTFSVLLDCGPGAFGVLPRYLDPRQLDVVALSHLHPDHCLDLCAFFVAARYSPSAPWPATPVYGPAGTGERLLRAYEVAPRDGVAGESGPSIAEHFDHRVWAAEQRLGPFVIRTVRVAHPVEAYAVRLEEVGTGRVLVYSGDTGPCAALIDLAAGADLLLVEASFLDRPDNPPDLHLSGADAARVATAAQVRACVLTHVPPWHDPAQVLAEARPHFSGPLELARAGAAWPVG